MSFSRTYGEGIPPEEWSHHALAVSHNLERLGLDFATARVLGCLHDLGKLTPQWQSYLFDKRVDRPFVEHKVHGAKALLDLLSDNSILARVVYSHHGRERVSGIQKQSESGDDCALKEALWGFANGGRTTRVEMPPLEREEKGLVEEALSLVSKLPQQYRETPSDTFVAANDFRLALARLVCADWDAAGGVESRPPSGNPSLMKELLAAVEKKYDAFGKPRTPVDILRNEIRLALEEKASVAPNAVYSLTVPTGGGKTLATMDWAVRHALKYGKRRIIVVVPYIRVIRQNASVMRDIFGAERVVEAHSLAPLNKSKRPEDHGWGGEIVVTTDVAFFRSWFTVNPRNLLRSLDMVNSVVIFDEVQWIPMTHMHPCTGFMKYLAENMGTTILLTTATMPDYSHTDNRGAFSKVVPTPLFPESVTDGWYERLRRVECRYIGSLTTAATLDHFTHLHPDDSALFIVNSTAHARELHGALCDAFGEDCTFHLSRRMTQGDIERVLAEVRGRLEAGRRALLVSTPLVEAGVDISFPVVYRSQCGLDSLAQSAGRCNRNGEMEKPGTVYLYKRDDKEGADELAKPFWNILNRGFKSLSMVYREEMESGSPLDIYDSARMRGYFHQFIVKNPERDEQRLLRGFGGCGRDIDLLDKRDETRVLVVPPELEDEVAAMLERQENEGARFKFTPREREIIAFNTVPVHIGERELARFSKRMPYIESSELLVFRLADGDAPFAYDPATGLEILKKILDKPRRGCYKTPAAATMTAMGKHNNKSITLW